jgi:hypothetical protein
MGFAKSTKFAFPHLHHVVILAAQFGHFGARFLHQCVLGLVPLFAFDVLSDLALMTVVVATLKIK